MTQGEVIALIKAFGGSGGGGGGSSKLIIDTHYDDDIGYVADATYSEVLAAAEAGADIYVAFSSITRDVNPISVCNYRVYDSTNGKWVDLFAQMLDVIDATTDAISIYLTAHPEYEDDGVTYPAGVDMSYDIYTWSASNS